MLCAGNRAALSALTWLGSGLCALCAITVRVPGSPHHWASRDWLPRPSSRLRRQAVIWVRSAQDSPPGPELRRQVGVLEEDSWERDMARAAACMGAAGGELWEALESFQRTLEVPKGGQDRVW